MAHVAVWDPFWFMREMLRWGSSSPAATFDVEETKDAYVYKAKLALPDQADAHHVKAALDNGQLTLVVPKAAAATPAPAPPRSRTRRTTSSDHGSSARTPRRATRRASRRG
jgi:Hsp20/alpha crystallin family